ncbi:uncharacterized protein [Lolium perenne]|uniref:uncharacterized protein n=1 Tax=Lolium perenne TaxID=4522 RepID=UPI0021F51B46|nr:uncharacterized protein LOC127339178 [Lolium perenne]
MQKRRGKPGKGQGHRPVRECAAAAAGNTDLLSVYVSRPKPIQPSPAHYASPLSYPLEEARRPAVAVAAAGGSNRPPQKHCETLLPRSLTVKKVSKLPTKDLEEFSKGALSGDLSESSMDNWLQVVP